MLLSVSGLDSPDITGEPRPRNLTVKDMGKVKPQISVGAALPKAVTIDTHPHTTKQVKM